MGHYRSINRNQQLIHAITGMNLKSTTLSEGSQIQRPHVVQFHLYKIPRKDKIKVTKWNKHYKAQEKRED